MKLSTNKDVNARARKTAIKMVQASFNHIIKDKELNAQVMRTDWFIESAIDSAKEIIKELIEITEEEHRTHLYLIQDYIPKVGYIDLKMPFNFNPN
jgi:hypothetical protein